MTNLRAKWQTQYFLQETADIQSRIDFNTSAVGFGGIDAGPISMLSVNPQGSPGFSIPSKKITNPLSLNAPGFNSLEVVDGINNPNRINYSMPTTAQVLRVFFKSFFQNISLTDEGSVTYQGSSFRKMKCSVEPYTSPIINNYLSTLKALTNDKIKEDNTSWEAWGSVVNHFGFKGEVGGLITFEASMLSMNFNRANVIGVISNSPRLKYLKSTGDAPIGASLYYENPQDTWTQFCSSMTVVATESDFTDPDSLSAGSVEVATSTGSLNFSSSDLTSYNGYFISIRFTDVNREKTYNELPMDFDVSIPPYKFSDLKIELDGNLIHINSFDLSMNNNPVPFFYDSTSAHSLKLGRINGNLNLSISWGDSNFGGSAALRSYLSNNIHTCYLYWGNKVVTDVNDASIKLTLLAKSINITTKGSELSSDVSFEVVDNGTDKQFEADFIFISGESTQHPSTVNISISDAHVIEKSFANVLISKDGFIFI